MNVMDLALLRTLLAIERRGSILRGRRADRRRGPVLRLAPDRRAGGGVRPAPVRPPTRRLRLTEAGWVYRDRVAPLVDALGEAADAARDVVPEPSGLLRVTTSVAFGERWLTPRLAAFRATHPRVEIELRLSDAMLDIAAEGIDLALRLGPRPEGALVAAKLFDTRYRAVAAPAYLENRDGPQVPGDLALHDGILFALPRFGTAWRFRRGSDAPVEDVTPRRVLTISNALATRRVALDGLGVALLAD